MPEDCFLGMKCTIDRLLHDRPQSICDHPPIGEEFQFELARRLPSLLREKKLDFGDCDKIFSTQWLSEDQVVVGTKCNKVGTFDSGWIWIQCINPALLLVAVCCGRQQ